MPGRTAGVLSKATCGTALELHQTTLLLARSELFLMIGIVNHSPSVCLSNSLTAVCLSVIFQRSSLSPQDEHLVNV